MIFTVSLALLVLIVALVYVTVTDHVASGPWWRIDFTQLIYSRAVLICFGFGVVALLNSLQQNSEPNAPNSLHSNSDSSLRQVVEPTLSNPLAYDVDAREWWRRTAR
jgi:hypothetical protein